jgi:hypothetical protein
VAEKRGAIFERARAVLDQVAEDLRSAAGDSRAPGVGLWIRFLADGDSEGRPRLRFTRAISESQDPVAREGGKYVETTPGLHLDLHRDADKLREGSLLAPGGYEEVLYAMASDPASTVLLRGIRSPPGGGGSLFIDRNVEAERAAPSRSRKVAPKSAAAPAKVAPEGGTVAEAAGPEDAPAVPADSGPLGAAARPFAEGVLHISFAFWTPFTSTWDRSKPATLRRGASTPSGPITTWDSTRAVLDEKAGAGEFAWRRIEGSLENSDDDVFPERVEVTLVMAGNADVEGMTVAEDLGPADKSVILSRWTGLPEEGPDCFVWIDGEWIGYEKIEAGRLVVSSAKGGGRGARGTRPASHPRGTAVDAGTVFRRVVEIPAGRVEPLLLEAKRGRP